MLERFIDAEANPLRQGGWPELEALLATEDDRLWDWLQRPDDPDAVRYRPLLERIRHGTEELH